MSHFKPKPLGEQVVVITGASSGIGRKAAWMLAEKGASVVLAARNEAALHEAARQVTERGGRALVVPTDVSDKAQVESLAAQAVAHYGRIDTWVNNAAVSMYAYLRTQPVEDIERVFAVNVLGTIHGCRAAIPHLSQNGGGTLINLGSILSERAIPLQGIYCASKHAVKGFTEALRMELDHEKIPINVTLVKPAVIDTPFYTQAKSLMGRRPRAVPPIYDVSVAAGAVVSACEQVPPRDLCRRLGGGTGGVAAAIPVTPGHGDEALGRLFRLFRGATLRRAGRRPLEPVPPGTGDRFDHGQ